MQAARVCSAAMPSLESSLNRASSPSPKRNGPSPTSAQRPTQSTCEPTWTDGAGLSNQGFAPSRPSTPGWPPGSRSPCSSPSMIGMWPPQHDTRRQLFPGAGESADPQHAIRILVDASEAQQLRGREQQAAPILDPFQRHLVVQMPEYVPLGLPPPPAHTHTDGRHAREGSGTARG